jgi:hypothetical protein
MQAEEHRRGGTRGGPTDTSTDGTGLDQMGYKQDCLASKDKWGLNKIWTWAVAQYSMNDSNTFVDTK